tara:strand:+ start:9839 stop:10714 length:876 start_codon:yes stop_codon:yes gene_type:complete
MYTVVTHSGSFHPDDVFAVASFQLLLGVENVEIIRTRDESIITDGDYVVDVGGVYNHVIKRYDHHQNGAPVRKNGIPYAGFGLMWKHYGEEICHSTEIAQVIENRLVQPIDAGDNGVNLFDLNEYEVQPFELYHFVSLYSPAWGSGGSKDEAFVKAVDWARSVIVRIIEKEQANLNLRQLIKETYEQAELKQILVFKVPVPMPALIEYSDVELVVCPDDPQLNDNWTTTCVRKNYDTFESRVRFPENWAGLSGKELQKVSSISDAGFCHKARFLFVAGSKESALKASEQAK